ncbi:MAG TPA: hypothetical protein VG674_03825 [Amycolatopsis sp.]|jgi:hypothetical protein|nr:hypothetical protein [Amycolatopsis sp.]
MGTTSHAITDRLAALLDEEHDLRTSAMHHGGLSPTTRRDWENSKRNSTP